MTAINTTVVANVKDFTKELVEFRLNQLTESHYATGKLLLTLN